MFSNKDRSKWWRMFEERRVVEWIRRWSHIFSHSANFQRSLQSKIDKSSLSLVRDERGEQHVIIKMEFAMTQLLLVFFQRGTLEIIKFAFRQNACNWRLMHRKINTHTHWDLNVMHWLTFSLNWIIMFLLFFGSLFELHYHILRLALVTRGKWLTLWERITRKKKNIFGSFLLLREMLHDPCAHFIRTHTNTHESNNDKCRNWEEKQNKHLKRCQNI